MRPLNWKLVGDDHSSANVLGRSIPISASFDVAILWDRLDSEYIRATEPESIGFTSAEAALRSAIKRLTVTTEAMRAKLGETARALPRRFCETPGHETVPAVCFGSYEEKQSQFACNECCAHGCEDGHCTPVISAECGEAWIEDGHRGCTGCGCSCHDKDETTAEASR